MDTGQAWISGLRIRAFFWVLGIALCTAAAIVFTSISWIPVIGVAVAAAAVSLNKVASRLSKPTCMGCGNDLSDQKLGNWGTVCHKCGSIHQPRPAKDQTAVAGLEQDDETV